jgi:hypothetical protein
LKVLGVQASDFAAYYDLVQALRRRGIAFVPVAPGEPAPPHVGVLVVTGPEGAPQPDDGVPIVRFDGSERTIEQALRALDGASTVRRCIVGIDPGERPGIAVLADGRIVKLIHARSPEAVRPAIEDALASLDAERFVLRVGNGAPTFRDRILQTLAGMPALLELVDESHSTPQSYHGSAERDTQAATRIALTPGLPLAASDVRPVVPTEGELRDIQRKSRLVSEGKVTISRALARHVALGRLTLDEAVQRHLGKA